MTEKQTADWGADSHSGSRIVNEDFIAFTRYDDETEIAQKGICLVVTDGSASMRCGQRAAQLAAFKVLEAYYSQQTSHDPKTALRHGLQSALTLLEYESAQTKCDGMAVSVAAAAIFNGQMHVAWVGSARAYVLRNGHITTLTTDLGQPGSPYLLGPAQGVLESTTLVEGGDRVILCTDGIYQVLNDDAIATLAASPARPEEAAHALIQGALAQHTHDNASAIVFDNGKALVKHTPKPVAPLRRNVQMIPVIAATMGIVLFVAGSATLLSRTTRPTGIAAAPAALTEVQQSGEATPTLEAALLITQAADPSAGQPAEPANETQSGPADAAPAGAPTLEIAPSETPIPEPSATPEPPTALPTLTPAPAPTDSTVAQATADAQRLGLQSRTNLEQPALTVTAYPTRAPTRAAPVRPTATRISPTRAAPPRVAPTPTRMVIRPTRPPVIRPSATPAVQPTIAAPVAPEPTARPTDVPKPTSPPQPPTAAPTSPPPPPADPTKAPPPPPTDAYIEWTSSDVDA